jgi:DNA adenine methylase
MQYMGGKALLAKYICSILEAERAGPDQLFIDAFTGGANIIAGMSGPRLGLDINPHMIQLWQEVAAGTFQPPARVTEGEYRIAKQWAALGAEPSSYLGFVGTGCAYAGCWFYSYSARHYRSGTLKNDSYQQSANWTTRYQKSLAGARFKCMDALAELHPQAALVYCDPPYADTTNYSGTPPFDSSLFWQRAREWSAKNTVLISEYKAPPDFRVLYTFPKSLGLRNRADKREVRLERLFKYAG